MRLPVNKQLIKKKVLRMSQSDKAVIRRFPDLHSLECMQATFIKHTFPRHSHDSYVIEFVEEGVDRFFCKNTIHHAPAGSFVLINPLEVHTGASSGSTALRYRSLYPSVEMMIEVQSQFQPHVRTIPLFTKTVVYDAILKKLFNQFWKSLEDSTPLRRQSLFMMFGLRLLQRHSFSNNEMRQIGIEKRPVQTIREYISDNYAEPISLDSLSAISGLSPFYLLRSFRKETGIPPYEYLISLRIERSKQFLLQRMSIAQVALETGFSDQCHFTRFFKRLVGVTPGQYLS